MKPDYPQSFVNAVKLLEQDGIHLSKTFPDGEFTITSKDVIEVMTDEIGWRSRIAQVPRDVVAKWYHYWASDFQCTGTTKKGEQCKREGSGYPRLNDFVHGETDRCWNCKESI